MMASDVRPCDARADTSALLTSLRLLTGISASKTTYQKKKNLSDHEGKHVISINKHKIQMKTLNRKNQNLLCSNFPACLVTCQES